MYLLPIHSHTFVLCNVFPKLCVHIYSVACILVYSRRSVNMPACMTLMGCACLCTCVYAWRVCVSVCEGRQTTDGSGRQCSPWREWRETLLSPVYCLVADARPAGPSHARTTPLSPLLLPGTRAWALRRAMGVKRGACGVVGSARHLRGVQQQQQQQQQKQRQPATPAAAACPHVASV